MFESKGLLWECAWSQECFSPFWNPAEFLLELPSEIHIKQPQHWMVELLVPVWDEKKKDPGGIVRRFWMPPTPTLDFTCCFYEAHPGPRERWRDVYLSLLRYSHSSNSGEKCWLGKINKLKDCTTHQRRCRLKQTIKSSWRRDLLLAVGRCIGLEVW